MPPESFEAQRSLGFPFGTRGDITNGFQSEGGQGAEGTEGAEEAEERFSSALKMNCPQCQKRYSVQPEAYANALRVSGESGAKFQCVFCQCRFIAHADLVPGGAKLADPNGGQAVQSSNRHPDLQGGRPASEVLTRVLKTVPVAPERRAAQQVPVAEMRCPKCRARTPVAASECRSCGVVFKKLAKREDEQFRSVVGTDASWSDRRELTEMWARVSERYEDEALHQAFVLACEKADCLAFASHKYSRLLEANSGDLIANKMRRQVVGLVSYKTEFAQERGNFGFRVPLLIDLVICLGGAVLVTGLMLPGYLSLVVIGLGAIALGVGLRLFLR